LYRKQYTVTTKFIAHDEKNEAKVGDRVTIIESRPLSARKHFRLSKILAKAGAGFEEADATADIPPEPEPETPPKKTRAKPARETKAEKPTEAIDSAQTEEKKE
jgi:small subunit ribosomal protein S17